MEVTEWIQQDTTMGWQNALILTSAFGWKTKQYRSVESRSKEGGLEFCGAAIMNAHTLTSDASISLGNPHANTPVILMLQPM
jgi:hypothetical protein